MRAPLGLDTVDDPTNDDRRFVRNRVRHEVLPLLGDIARRDVVPLLVRTADAAPRRRRAARPTSPAALDPTDARALAAADPALARRALRAWLTADGYPPDLATVDRALDVARGARRPATWAVVDAWNGTGSVCRSCRGDPEQPSPTAQ